MSEQLPHQVTVKVLDPDGFSEFYTIRAATVNELMTNVQAFKDWLKKKGYTPDQSSNGGSAPTNGNDAVGATPVCEFHGPMKRSKKFNGWFCPSKMGDGSYCKSKVED